MKNHIQMFSVQGEITAQDAKVLRSSLFTFLESDPLFLVIDLSCATLMIPEEEIHSLLSEVRSLASAKNINLTIAQTDFESLRAPRQVVDMALEKRARILQSKVELREQIQTQIVHLTQENLTLKEKMKRPRLLAPFSFLDRLWSAK